MATKIKDIIDYYSEHVVSDEIKERVLQRLSDSKDEKEEDEALRTLWDKADSAYMDEEEISTAYKRLFRKDIDSSKGKTFQIFTWQRVAALVIPLVMLVVFGKIYVQMRNELKASQAIAMMQEHTIKGESKTLALADGTKVKLSQGSVLLYPASLKARSERCSWQVRLSSISSMMKSIRSMSALRILRLQIWVLHSRFLLILPTRKLLLRSKRAR